MDTSKPIPSFCGHGDIRPLIFKFLLPGMMVFAGVLTLRATVKPAGVLLALLLASAGLTHFFLVGLVSPRQDCLYYRRFFHWRRLEYEEVVKCGRSVIMFPLAYLKLKHYEPPFGKLYFVLHSSVEWVWQQGGRDRETMDYIRQRVGLPAASLTSLPQERVRSEVGPISKATWKGPMIQCAFSFVAGLAFQFLSVFVHGKLWFAIRWPYNLVVGLILIAGLLALRLRGGSLWLSLGLGAIVGEMLVRFLR